MVSVSIKGLPESCCHSSMMHSLRRAVVSTSLGTAELLWQKSGLESIPNECTDFNDHKVLSALEKRGIPGIPVHLPRQVLWQRPTSPRGCCPSTVAQSSWSAFY